MGRSISVGRATVDRLHETIDEVMREPSEREPVSRLRESIEAADGLNRAADLIEGVPSPRCDRPDARLVAA